MPQTDHECSKKKYGFILYFFDEAINISEDKVAAYSKTWLDIINSMVVRVDLTDDCT